MIGPTPGTEASRSSFSRQTGEPRTSSSISLSSLGEFLLERLEQTQDALLQTRLRRGSSRCRSATIISTIWRRRATRSASRRVASSGNGRTSGLVASTKRAMTAASIGSVLARLPMPGRSGAPAPD